MGILRDRRSVSWMERTALLLAVAYLGLHTWPRAWSKLNTDFPNFYLTARLAHEGYDTSRIYEWVWLERQKDHRAIDISAVAFIPNAPFSALIMWPISELQPLDAKHVWMLVNLALLIPLCWLLRSITGLSYQRIALVCALSFPLHRNLLFGQYYLLLLVLIVAACWAYLKERYFLSGALIAIAAACKIFPVLIVAFFLQRRNWRALTSALVTGIAAAALSIAVFGWNVHRTFVHEALPWALHGEAMSPYVISAASISSLLHYLFLSESEWNPHPWHNSILLYALLQPALQMLLLAPAILLIRRKDQSRQRIALEWVGLLTASLAISTLPSSYHFVLMIFPMCVLGAFLIERGALGWLAALLIAYLGIGFPMPSPNHQMGPAILFYIPRLPLMVAVLLGTYALLRSGRDPNAGLDWTHYAWVGFMTVAALFSIQSTFRLERAVRQEYAYRVALATPSLLHSDPVGDDGGTRYIGLNVDGYHFAAAGNSAWDLTQIDSSPGDDLSFAASPEQLLIEKARSRDSAIINLREPAKTIIEAGHNPMLSIDRQDLAFVRDDHGRGRLMMQPSFQSGGSNAVALTPPSINVYEAAFSSRSEYAFAGVENGRPPQIYLSDRSHSNTRLDLGESRYPALSPDGRWMAYSHLDHGMWNLWIRDQETGATRRVAELPCNQIEPSWESDSKTLVYATDCGRSLWLTGISRRRVIP
jgi:hypothetical protein